MNCKRERPRRPQISAGVVFGLTLIGLGVAFLLHNLCYIYILDVLVFWPCALMAAGLVRVWNRGFSNVWGQTLLTGGALLQLFQLQIYYKSLYFNFIEMWWPALIIWVGLLVTVKAFAPKKCRQRARRPPPVRADGDGWPGHGDGQAAPTSSGGDACNNNYSDNHNNYN